jgi:hypothetical protein
VNHPSQDEMADWARKSRLRDSQQCPGLPSPDAVTLDIDELNRTLTEFQWEVTSYGPQFYAQDFVGATPLYKAPEGEWERLPDHLGATRAYRIEDVPRLKLALQRLGLANPSGIVTIFDMGWIVRLWVKPDVARKLRLLGATMLDVTTERARDGVNSLYIGPDQRAMYQAVLDN